MKHIGLLIIFFASTMWGYLSVKKEKDRIIRMEGLLLLIREIRRSIAFMQVPLNEIYNRFQCESLEKCGMLPCLRRNGIKAAYEATREAFSLDDFCENRILSFADRLGKHPTEEELRSCDDIEALLATVLEEAKKAYPMKRKLYSALGVSLGIGAVILLL